MGFTPPEVFISALPDQIEQSRNLEQSRNAPQGQIDCKAEAHVDLEHIFVLLSTGMTALFAQGRVAFGNPGFALLNQMRNVKPR